MMTTRWIVVVEPNAEKELRKLPKEVSIILGNFKQDLENEGPIPRGWIIKHVLGRPGVYAARLKREYRVLYQVIEPHVIVLSISHRREAY